MLKFYESTSNFMEKTYSGWDEHDPKVIQDAFGGFLNGVGNIVDAAVFSRSDIKSEQPSVCIILLIFNNLLKFQQK